MINKVVLQGFVGGEPEVRSFESGAKMARIRMATTEDVYIRKSNETRQHTEWHTVIFWREAADFADKHIHKGSKIYVEGALRSRETTNNDGAKYIVTEIVGREIKIISSPKPSTPNSSTSPSLPEITPPKEDSDNLPF